jgi:hypothetical protein
LIIYVPTLGLEKAIVVDPVKATCNIFPVDKSKVVVLVELIELGWVSSKVLAFTFEVAKSVKVRPPLTVYDLSALKSKVLPLMLIVLELGTAPKLTKVGSI